MPLSDFFPRTPPPLTEHNLPSQHGRVFIVTGATSGVGAALAGLLFAAGGVVYVCGRSGGKVEAVIAGIKKEKGGKGGKGRLEAMVLDLADLKTIREAVRGFEEREGRLDGLVHNAGVMVPPRGSRSVQGHDLEIATHCLAPFLLTTLLAPLLQRTAALPPSDQTQAPPNPVRVVWVATMVSVGTPAGGMELEGSGAPVVQKGARENYVQSKIGGVWLAGEFAQRLNQNVDKSGEIMNLAVHPGFMATSLQKNMPAPARGLTRLVFKPAIWGAYTELFAGFSSDLSAKDNGAFITAWGRIAELPEVVKKGQKLKNEGGNGKADLFWKWCERETKPFL